MIDLKLNVESSSQASFSKQLQQQQEQQQSQQITTFFDKSKQFTQSIHDSYSIDSLRPTTTRNTKIDQNSKN